MKTKLILILFVLLFSVYTGWTIGDLDRNEDYVDTEISTIITELGVVQDTLDARLPWCGYPGAQIDTCTTPDGSAAAGWVAGAAHAMFHATGTVIIHAIYGLCVESISEQAAAATIEVGIAGATGLLIATTDPPTDIAAGDIWTNSGTASLIPFGTPSDGVIVTDIDIDMTCGGVGGVDNINNGYITIFIVWSPLPASSDGGAGTTGYLARTAWD